MLKSAQSLFSIHLSIKFYAALQVREKTRFPNAQKDSKFSDFMRHNIAQFAKLSCR